MASLIQLFPFHSYPSFYCHYFFFFPFFCVMLCLMFPIPLLSRRSPRPIVTFYFFFFPFCLQRSALSFPLVIFPVLSSLGRSSSFPCCPPSPSQLLVHDVMLCFIPLKFLHLYFFFLWRFPYFSFYCLLRTICNSLSVPFASSVLSFYSS